MNWANGSNRFAGWWIAGVVTAVVLVMPSPSRAAINENQVLVLYNSQGADTSGSGRSDSQAIFEHYRTHRPGVLGLDLNDPTLSPGNISYADYILKIRNPVRSYLSQNNLQQQVISIVLTKNLPHRIQDFNTATNVGDNPAAMLTQFNEGRATTATVDSELTLLWQPLELGEAGAAMDSRADNLIVNPYHNVTTSIASLSRAQITGTKQYQKLGGTAWRMHQSGSFSHAGNMYLPVRLDGHTVADVLSMIDRAQFANYNQHVDQIIIDENGTREYDNTSLFVGSTIGHLGNDYEETAALLSPKYAALIFNEDSEFFIGQGSAYTGSVPGTAIEGEVAALVSYAGNHGDNDDGKFETGFVESFAGQLAAGAIINTAESYNAKQFGGLSGFQDQSQLAAFIATGGTFGIGSAWEPLAFSLPDNEVLLEAFLFRGQTWAEAAWASIPWLSWQQVVVGDPLATAHLITDSKTVSWRGNAPNSGLPGDGFSWASFANWQRDGVQDANFQLGDTVVLAPGSTSLNINLQGDRIIESLQWQAAYRLSNGRLFVRTGNITVDENVTATSDVPIYTTRGLNKLGEGTLVVNGRTDRATVTAGMLGGTGPLAGVTVLPQAGLAPGRTSAAGTMAITGDLMMSEGSRLLVDLDGNTLTADTLDVSGRAVLAGDVDLHPVNNFLAQLSRGTVLDLAILTADQIEGTFSSLLLNDTPLEMVPAGVTDTTAVQHAGNGLFEQLVYGESSVSLSSYLALPGDANGDRAVDDLDLSIWQANRFATNTNWLTADFNLDGVTDGLDFHLWLSNYGATITVAQPSLVPEPGSGLLLLASLLPLIRWRQGRRN